MDHVQLLYTILFSKQSRHLEFSRLYNRFVLVVSQYVISLVQQVNYLVPTFYPYRNKSTINICTYIKFMFLFSAFLSSFLCSVNIASANLAIYFYLSVT